MRLALRLVLVGFSFLSLSAAEIPSAVVPQGVGVNIHFVTGHEKDLDLIAKAGFKFVRMDFVWTETEPRKGEYDWRGYEQLLNNLDSRGIRALFILDYSHHLYEQEVTSPHPITHQEHKTTASPQHAESVAAFARWAGAAAKHFRGRHILWEIWNEPNGHFWSPKPDVKQYTELALATCKAVREADPEATIIGPATSGFPWEFLEEFLKSGVLEWLDGVSVHPYRDRRNGPETAAADYKKLRGMIDEYAPAASKQRLPILSGEWGYSSYSKGVTLETQAAFAVRQQLSNLLNNVPLSIWYDWKNDGDDASENEHNFGTVTSELKGKPAYGAIRAMTQQLSGYHLVRRVSVPDEKDFVLVFANGAGDQKVAAWTTGEPHTLNLKTKERDGGAPRERVPIDGLGIEISALPTYVQLGPGMAFDK
jgi:hypothetical protein